ncbi:L-galactose dehydrogenase-like isoform X1 [Stegodyphus dumicola]|uniref:L-galactose dehydrogenase-like isoform X1 n=1 Tax=Stegodyphus dumicola TaxID=202533 RepID=UPI0015B0BE8A|nr:L-galactose dehydrogenase-like isoform X1 [Stegodyphus dumicola]
MGLLTNNGPPDWHPAGSELKAACEQAAKYCKEREVNISKLAACYSFSQPAIDVHLIGMQNRKLLEMNLHSIMNGLTSYEKTIQDEVSKKFFENLSVPHWENKEVQSYWEKMKEINT